MLTQNQLYLTSRMFVAAGKAGVPFDLAKFSNDRSYAFEVLGHLASASPNRELQALVAEVILALNEGVPKIAAQPSAPELPKQELQPEPATPNKYVGRLR
jgi:hypothetical protein